MNRYQLPINLLIADDHQLIIELFLSPGTIDTHRKNILAKLHLKNSAALVKYAADHKLL